MKRIFAVAFVLLTAPLMLAAQVDKQIASIRAEVNAINKAAPKYRKETRTVEGISLEGAEATYFTSGRGLKKITAKMYGETFRATAELYYSGEELIFAYQRVERYDTHIAMKPPPKVVKVIETRAYYAGGQVIRVLEGRKALAAKGVAFADAEKDVKELSEKLKAALEK
jgi:hypothetical protein